MSDLVKRLRIKAGMIEMGEMIAWGSDSALMREAADALEMVAPAVQGEPVGYVRPYQLEALRSGKACAITMKDKPAAHNLVTIPLYATPQTAPDVAGLVEALEWLRGAINCTPENDKHKIGVWISTVHPRIRQIDGLLAAHRKGGDT